MKRKKILYIVVVYCVVALIIGVTASMEQVRAEERKEIDLSLTPKDVLFDVSNMKPGDWTERSIRVNNEGTAKFLYTLSAEFADGSKKLYEALTLEVKDKERVLYKGSLGGFTKLAGRILSAGQSEQLIYTVRFPEEFGNEYQGLGTKVKFVFYAEADGSNAGTPENPNGNTSNTGTTDKPGGVTSVDNSSTNVSNLNMNYGLLPRTGTHYMNTILIGIGLILIGLFVYKKRAKR